MIDRILECPEAEGSLSHLVRQKGDSGRCAITRSTSCSSSFFYPNRKGGYELLNL